MTGRFTRPYTTTLTQEVFVVNTAPLTVLGDYSMDEKSINVHPNDAFDLGLLTSTHVVRIHVGDAIDPSSLPDDAFTYGTLHIRNEVRDGHIEIGLRAAKRLGARRAIVHYTPGERYGTILISPA